MRGWIKSEFILFILAIPLIAGVAPSHGEELRFGVAPSLGETEVRAEMEPLLTYLSGALGRMVSLYIAKDDGDLRTQMEAGALDVGIFSPFGYVAGARGGKIRIIAQSILDGSATYRANIIKRFDSGIQSLADLEGKRFAFVDPKSASGYVYPRALLIEKGINPEHAFKETIFAGTHDKVIAAVLFGPAAAGATYEGAVAMAKAQGFPTFDLEVLASTDPIAHDAIAVRVGLDDALVKGIQTALVELDRSPAGRQVIARSRKKLTGYAPANDSLYDVVRRAEKSGGK
jgi:phosphate/phosphite/phosphonate ABC transporter binding protein